MELPESLASRLIFLTGRVGGLGEREVGLSDPSVFGKLGRELSKGRLPPRFLPGDDPLV